MAYVSMGEAHRRITEYLNRFCDAVSYQDSSTLCRLLSFSSNSPPLLSLADALNVFQVHIFSVKSRPMIQISSLEYVPVISGMILVNW